LSSQVACESSVAIHHLPIPLIDSTPLSLATVLPVSDLGHASSRDTEHGNDDSIRNQGLERDGHRDKFVGAKPESSLVLSMTEISDVVEGQLHRDRAS
jgi:hypothetical protein